MKGIMFTEKMFIAVIEGRKNQTRRVISKLPEKAQLIGKGITDFTTFTHPENDTTMITGVYPRYRTGEIVYLKEPYMPYPIDYEKPFYRYGVADPVEATKVFPWKNKMFMPEKYSRYKIKITRIRVERVNDISLEDAIGEGFNHPGEFHNIWISLHGMASLSANPYVFVYEFKVQ